MHVLYMYDIMNSDSLDDEDDSADSYNNSNKTDGNAKEFTKLRCCPKKNIYLWIVIFQLNWRIPL